MIKRPKKHISFGITGAPGVGKTTIVEEVARRASRTCQVQVSRDVARNLASKGVRINTKCETEDYLAFFTIRLRDMLRLRGDLVIYDRSLLDVLIFMELNKNASKWLKELATELIEWEMAQLSLYFYVPIEFEAEPDGFRVVDPLVNRRIDRITLKLLQEYRPDFITLRGPICERVNIVLESLGQVGLDFRAE